MVVGLLVVFFMELVLFLLALFLQMRRMKIMSSKFDGDFDEQQKNNWHYHYSYLP
jgi:hypothetical protein